MMFYVVAVSAICVIICFRRRCFEWLRDVKLTMFATFMNRVQVTMNQRLKDRKQRLLSDGLKRLDDRLRELEKHHQQDSSNADRRFNVVEIGAGAGANFQFYPPGVTVTCVEPNSKFESHIRRNADGFPDLRIGKFHVAFAEDMTKCIESESADAVVCTMVLCSVRSVDQCLKEVIRILKPGGQFFFLEHIRADENGPGRARFMQWLLQKPWKFLFDCDVSRSTDEIIRSAAFSHVSIEQFDAVELLKPTPVVPISACVDAFRLHVMGVATK